jgi:hypothetical protein
MFQTRIFLWEFPIGSYVKLSSVVVAIMVGGLKCRTQFRKVTTQGTFQQSSFRGEFFFLILVGSRDHRTLFSRGPHMEHSNKVCLQLVQWLLRRRLKCEMLTDGRRKVMAIAHLA